MKLSNLARAITLPFILLSSGVYSDVTGIEITSREMLSAADVGFTYEAVYGVVRFTLDPNDPANATIVDLQNVDTNSDGLVEYSADFKMLIPPAELANGGLLYNVNNRGNSRTPPEDSLQHPLTEMGFTYLVTGWINELAPREGRIRLHAPVVGNESAPVTGAVRYEVSVGSVANDVNIAGGGHLAYYPTEDGLANATLTQRLYQEDPRIPVQRSDFSLNVIDVPQSNQPEVTLNVDGGLQPGYLYELIYEARGPVLAGAGMAGIRDIVSLIRYEGDSALLEELDVPDIEHTVAWGVSQSGRLLRQFVYDGLNADPEGRKVFDGVIPIIAGGGFGMFNNRFAMPTRTNGHHSNYLYPNDLFPFTYGDSTDPYTGRTDGVLRAARASGTEPYVMHIQTSNEYWLRAGSLPHTSPDGSSDADIPDNVRFYTIGGSQHGSRDGIPQEPTSGQLPGNPNMWSPISETLIASMYDWVANDELPPPSRYPKISEGTLVSSHINGRINREAWNALDGINHPSSIYKPRHTNYGQRWQSERIIDQHPDYSDHEYNAMVPAVNTDNNDLAESTVLPPLTQVPLGTFVPWNLRSPVFGAEESLARLTGGYIPYPDNTAAAVQMRDPRNSIEGLYPSFDDYLNEFEQATDELIEEGFLLPGFKEEYMAVARFNETVFE